MHRSESGTAIFRYPAYFQTCGWRIVISPMIPQDSPSCNYSAMRNLVVPFSERRLYTFRGSSASEAVIPLGLHVTPVLVSLCRYCAGTLSFPSIGVSFEKSRCPRFVGNIDS